MAVQRLNCLSLLNAIKVSYQNGELKVGCNANLLDNWDFLNPVKEGTNLARWRVVSGTYSIGSNGLTLNGTIKQIREYAINKQTVASVKMVSGTATASYDDAAKTFTITSSGGVIAAAKLEIGSVSTIEGDPPMDYVAELQKWKYYYRDLPLCNLVGIGSSAREVRITLTFEASPMRKPPTVTVTNAAAVVAGVWENAAPYIDPVDPSKNKEAVTIISSSTRHVTFGLTMPSNKVVANSAYLTRFELKLDADFPQS